MQYNKIIEVIETFVILFKSFVKEDWEWLPDGVKDVLSQIADIAKAIINDPLGFVAGVMSSLKDMVSQLFETIGQAILDGLKFLGQKIWEGLKSIRKAIWAGLSAALGWMCTWPAWAQVLIGVGAFGAALGKFATTGKNAQKFNKVTSTLKATKVSQKAIKVKNAIKNTAEQVKKWLLSGRTGKVIKAVK